MPPVNATTNTSIICTGESATLTANGANTFTWNTSSTNTIIIVSPTINTTYTVTGTDANGCNNFATVTQAVNLCTGIVMSGGVKTQLIIYPNPSSGIFNLELSSAENSMEIYNSTGQLILTQKISSEKTTVDLSKYANGLYYIKVKDSEEKIKVNKE